MFNPLSRNPGSPKIVRVFIYDVAYNIYLVLCKLVNLLYYFEIVPLLIYSFPQNYIKP